MATRHIPEEFYECLRSPAPATPQVRSLRLDGQGQNPRIQLERLGATPTGSAQSRPPREGQPGRSALGLTFSRVPGEPMLSFLPRTWPSWQLLDLALTLAASIPLFLNTRLKSMLACLPSVFSLKHKRRQKTNEMFGKCKLDFISHLSILVVLVNSCLGWYCSAVR